MDVLWLVVIPFRIILLSTEFLNWWPISHPCRDMGRICKTFALNIWIFQECFRTFFIASHYKWTFVPVRPRQKTTCQNQQSFQSHYFTVISLLQKTIIWWFPWKFLYDWLTPFESEADSTNCCQVNNRKDPENLDIWVWKSIEASESGKCFRSPWKRGEIWGNK